MFSDGTTAAAVLVLAVLVAAARRGELLGLLGEPGAAVDLGGGDAEAGQGGAALDLAAALAAFDVTHYVSDYLGDSMSDNQASYTAADNLAAFLLTIRRAEGTAGPDGYRTMFGGALFTSWADHPRRAVQFGARRLWTSAAGAYQFMAVSPLPGGGSTKVDTWDRIKRRLGLPDFSPASQDAAAVELIREAGALDDVHAGRFDAALAAVRSIWASLPGAGYGQPEQSLAMLRGFYANAGGSFS